MNRCAERRRAPERFLSTARRLALTFCLIALASGARAQSDAQPSAIPELPRGDGEVIGQLDHPDGPRAAAGANVVLYGLAADGAPGVRDTLADAEGRFRFGDVSTAEGAVYLIGARHRGIPFFGPRVSFAAGQKSIAVRLSVSDPTSDTSRATTGETQLQFEWSGNVLQVLETHHVGTSGESVIVVPPEGRAGVRAVFEAQLPEGALEFAAAPPSGDDAFTREGSRVRFWGPVYPGEQEVRFAYQMPIDHREGDDDGLVTLRRPPSPGSEVVSILVPENGGITLAGAGLQASGNQTIGERSYRRFAYQPKDPDASLRIRVPKVERDRGRVGLSRADFWLELDDTAVSVNAELQLLTQSGVPVVGTPEEPVVSIPLPPGAELLGLAPVAREMGAIPLDGAVGLVGPIPPGASAVALRYRLPVGAGERGGVVLALRVPVEAPVVNVLVADTGVSIQSERLHRRRPFTSGTRTYLHREAYRVEPGETVDVVLRPISRAGVPPLAMNGAAALAMIGATWFLIAPLRRHSPLAASTARENPWAVRRAAVVQDIRDLDHDFETGKIDRSDYEGLRVRMRERAIDLLRRQESEAASPTPFQSTAAGIAAAAHCTACGEALRESWKFCAKCGAQVAPPA